MIDVLKRHEIQVQRRAGHTLEDVATFSGVSIGSVRRVVAEAEPERRRVGLRQGLVRITS